MSIAIVFHKEKKSEQDYILKRFQNDGFLISKNSSIAHMVLIAATDEMLEKEAERINLLIHNAKGILQHFQIENRKDFKGFKTNEMFKPSEKNLLLLSLMEQVTRLDLQCLITLSTTQVVTDKEFTGLSKDHQISIGSELITSAKAAEMVECVFPPHDHELRKKLFTKAMYSLPCNSSGTVLRNNRCCSL
jgi:hypothetical protein